MIDGTTYRRFAKDPSKYRDALLIDVDGMGRKLGKVMDPWQRDDFNRLDPAILHCLGRTPNNRPKMRAYFERPRGHSKTNDIAVIVSYLLAFAPRPLRCYAFAADRDQAALLRDACQRLTKLNPWLGKILRVDKNQVTNIGTDHPGHDATLSIETSDVGSSYGILPDAIIFDEITHWSESAEALWASLLSSAAKRRNCLMIGIANAGFEGTWQHKLRESISTDNDWLFSRLDGATASWIDQKTLEEQRRLLPSSAYLRLWCNQWSTGEAEPAIAPGDIERAFKRPHLALHGSEPAYAYVAGLDLGITRDHAALVVLAVRRNESRDDSNQIRLAHVKRWRPTANAKVNLMEVEEELRSVVSRYSPIVAVDPWQAELMAQRLKYDGVEVRHISPTAANLRDMASRVRETFSDHRIRLTDSEGLRRDIERLQLVETSYGYRLQSPRDRTGHGDAASALCVALLVASEVTAAKPPRVPVFI